MSDEIQLENVPYESIEAMLGSKEGLESFAATLRSHEIREIDGPPIKIQVVSIAWAPIAVAIAVHVIQHAVDKLIDGWFGERSDFDLQALLHDFIQAVAAVVRQQLDERDLRIMSEEAASTKSWYSQYNDSRNEADKRWYLNQAHQAAHNLTFHAAPFTYRAVSTFAIAGGLELAALREKARHDTGGMTMLRKRAEELLKASEGFKSSLDQYNRSRFGPVHPFIHSFSWTYTLDGQWIGVRGRTQEECTRNREQNIAKEFARLESQVLVPFYDVREKWLEITRLR
jgi:hypothetical protein